MNENFYNTIKKFDFIFSDNDNPYKIKGLDYGQCSDSYKFTYIFPIHLPV